MTDKEKRELKDGVISVFKRFNILDRTATIGVLRDDVLRYINSLQEEPVSKDLEEACDEYYDETWDEHGGKAMVVDGCHDIWFPSQATDDFYKAGALWQKEQIIKNAISMDVYYETEWDDIHKFLRKNLDGEKVKLLIIKEE